VVGPDAAIISSPLTREKTIALAARAFGSGSSASGGSDFALRPATMTLSQELTIYLGDNLPVIEQALETAALTLGSDKSRGYMLEMICADFLADANVENGDVDISSDRTQSLL
jgi:hypothetical protein